MTYMAFDPAVPTVAQTRQAAVDAMRANLQALRDALIVTGILQGFDYSQAGGTAEQPAQLFYTRGSEWIRVDLTWGASGGGAGAVTKAAHYYSADAGANYDPMADLAGNYVVTLAYDASGNCTSTTWGATP